MSRYMKLPLKAVDKGNDPTAIHNSAESRFWSKYADVHTSKQPSLISCLSFSPVAPYELAVCSSTRVQIYDSNFSTMNKSFNRFKSTVTWATFRNDGQMLATGSDDNTVSVFEVSTKTRLRHMSKHKAPVRCVNFIDDGTTLLSCSDDKTAMGIHIPTETTKFRLLGHTDFVRVGFESVANKSVMVTGSYDHTIKLWDARAAQDATCVLTMDHGAPISALIQDVTGNLLISAGENRIRVWDVVAGGTLLHEIQAHQKAISSLALDSSGLRLLSGSIDQHVNVYDTRNGYDLVHSMAFNSPVMSVAFAPDASTLAVGLADGTLTMRRRPNDDFSSQMSMPTKRLGYHDRMSKGVRYTSAADDFVVQRPDKHRLAVYDKYLRKFQHHYALDSALAKNDKAAVISIFEEILIKGVANQSLGNREESTLVPILKFIVRYITNPHYTNTLIDITMILIEMYSSMLGQFPAIDELFVQLNQRLNQEIAFQAECHSLQGQLDVLLTSAVPLDSVETKWAEPEDETGTSAGDEEPEQQDNSAELSVKASMLEIQSMSSAKKQMQFKK